MIYYEVCINILSYLSTEDVGSQTRASYFSNFLFLILDPSAQGFDFSEQNDHET